MSLFEAEIDSPRAGKPAPPQSHVDLALSAQLVVAWAGETGEDRRLGWWRSDMASEFGGEDLLRRLLPSTWRWAVLQSAREAAVRKDAELRRHDSAPDRIVSLFHLGFDLNERIEERLQDLKRSGRPPHDALPRAAVVYERWQPQAFWAWVGDHGSAETSPSPVGRRLKGAPPDGLDALVRKLVAGLAPAADAYPLPHFRQAE